MLHYLNNTYDLDIEGKPKFLEGKFLRSAGSIFDLSSYTFDSKAQTLTSKEGDTIIQIEDKAVYSLLDKKPLPEKAVKPVRSKISNLAVSNVVTSNFNQSDITPVVNQHDVTDVDNQLVVAPNDNQSDDAADVIQSDVAASPPSENIDYVANDINKSSKIGSFTKGVSNFFSSKTSESFDKKEKRNNGIIFINRLNLIQNKIKEKTNEINKISTGIISINSINASLQNLLVNKRNLNKEITSLKSTINSLNKEINELKQKYPIDQIMIDANQTEEINNILKEIKKIQNKVNEFEIKIEENTLSISNICKQNGGTRRRTNRRKATNKKRRPTKKYKRRH